MTWSRDSSKPKYKARSPRSQAAVRKVNARLDLPVPGVPDTRMLLPRKKPCAPNMPSRSGTPVEILSDDARCVSPTDEMGSTEIPDSPRSEERRVGKEC